MPELPRITRVQDEEAQAEHRRQLLQRDFLKGLWEEEAHTEAEAEVDAVKVEAPSSKELKLPEQIRAFRLPAAAHTQDDSEQIRQPRLTLSSYPTRRPKLRLALPEAAEAQAIPIEEQDSPNVNAAPSMTEVESISDSQMADLSLPSEDFVSDEMPNVSSEEEPSLPSIASNQSSPAAEKKDVLKPQRLFGGGPLQRAAQAEQEAAKAEAHKARLEEQGIRPRRLLDLRHASKSIQEALLRPSFYVKHNPSRLHSLSEAVDFARRLHPLPREMQNVQRPAQRTWLLSQIRSCRSEQDLRRLAYALQARELCLLFPILAGLKQSDRIEKLNRLILLRASRYLYFQGWITLQYAYPRSSVQSTLSELCQLLERNQLPEQDLQLDPNAYLDLDLGPEHFNWQQVPLISEVALPNSRHFLSSLVNRINQHNLSGQEFFQRYAIYRDLPLGQGIKGQWEMMNLGKRRQFFS